MDQGSYTHVKRTQLETLIADLKKSINDDPHVAGCIKHYQAQLQELLK